jgi:hypothetical protein
MRNLLVRLLGDCFPQVLNLDIAKDHWKQLLVRHTALPWMGEQSKTRVVYEGKDGSSVNLMLLPKLQRSCTYETPSGVQATQKRYDCKGAVLSFLSNFQACNHHVRHFSVHSGRNLKFSTSLAVDHWFRTWLCWTM